MLRHLVTSLVLLGVSAAIWLLCTMVVMQYEEHYQAGDSMSSLEWAALHTNNAVVPALLVLGVVFLAVFFWRLNRTTSK